eukprot:gene54736-17260_t
MDCTLRPSAAVRTPRRATVHAVVGGGGACAQRWGSEPLLDRDLSAACLSPNAAHLCVGTHAGTVAVYAVRGTLGAGRHGAAEA